MTRISSSLTIWYKRAFPIFWFGFLAVFIAVPLLSGVSEKFLMVLVVPCILAVFGFFLMKNLIWDLVDEVYDDQDFLLIKNHGTEERVALADVMNVSATTFMNPPRTTLRLVDPGKFGNEIAFMPAYEFTFNPFAKNQVAEDLMLRVDKARASRAAQGQGRR